MNCQFKCVDGCLAKPLFLIAHVKFSAFGSFERSKFEEINKFETSKYFFAAARLRFWAWTVGVDVVNRGVRYLL